MKKRSYRRTDVKQVSVSGLCEKAVKRSAERIYVGLDVAKAEIVACLRWDFDDFERPWSIKNPLEIGRLVEMLLELKAACGSIIVAMESTGTYGEAVRKALTDAFLDVERVSGKAVKDYKEVFDGVPSQHDGKDAAIISELAAIGKGTPWPYVPPTEEEDRMRLLVHRNDAYRLQANEWTCRLEGLLARHWPELTGLLKLNSKTLLRAIIKYGGPAGLAADENATEQLQGWGRGRLKPEKIDLIVASAKSTQGLPVSPVQQGWLQEVAEQTLLALEEVESCDKALSPMAESNEKIRPYVKPVGGPTLCVMWATVGDPRKYHSAGAFLKALGMNLKEISSGKRKGELAISKRGPSLARKWIYYWALRAVQTPELKPWYETYKQVGNKQPGDKTNDYRSMKGLIAMMRKLCRSLWYTMVHDLEFDYGKVFPGKPITHLAQAKLRDSGGSGKGSSPPAGTGKALPKPVILGRRVEATT